MARAGGRRIPATTTPAGAFSEFATLGLGTHVFAADINERGQVVGHVAGDAFGASATPMLWDLAAGSAMRLPDGFNAYQINDVGVMAVQGGEAGNRLYWNGFERPLPVFASDLNNWGQVISTNSRASLWTGSTSVLLDVGGRSSTTALDLSNTGLVVGVREYNRTGVSAYETGIWDASGSFVRLAGFADSEQDAALAINDRGQAAGYSSHCAIIDGYYLWHCRQHEAVVWSADGSMVNLNDAVPHLPQGWSLEMARDINELGEVLAIARDAAGREHTVVLTPVPEPSTYALMLSGLAMLWMGRRREPRVRDRSAAPA